MTDVRTIPVDPVSAERLAANGLTYRLIDTSSASDVAGFVRADFRGFLDGDPTDEQIAGEQGLLQTRRNVAVFENTAADGAWPVATVNSWITPLTTYGGELDMWAISSVTVAGTHRRRGIARALLEGELRAAKAAGVAIAGLTVSEATIYGRYGFASALPAAKVTIDTRRAGWAGPAVAGRVEYLDREQLAAELSAVHETARSGRAGQIVGWESRWRRMAGLTPGHPEPLKARGVRYVDESGVTQGVMAYKIVDAPGGFRFGLEVLHLSTLTDDALVALWAFAAQHDLVDTVTADLRPIDDPIVWLVADQRGVTVQIHDHGWLRVLDVPVALAARRYSAPLDVVIHVDDALGFAEGTWRVRVGTDGQASVEDAGGHSADVSMDVSTLSALYAGGVSAVQLRAAGRVHGAWDSAVALDGALRTPQAPLLGIWY